MRPRAPRPRAFEDSQVHPQSTPLQCSFSICALIPTFNRAAVVGRAIESVLAQTRAADEIIVVDDGSSDGTRDVLAAYGDRIKVVQKVNGGVSSARNAGVERSRARFVAFLDSDDVWAASHLATIERAIGETAEEAALYFSDIRLPPAQGGTSVWAQIRFAIEGSWELRPPGCDWLFLPRQPMLIPASVVSREAYLGVGGCDEGLTAREDTHLFFKLGVGRAVCAVAGMAGEVTEDRDSSLTTSFTPDDRVYLRSTVRLYDDLLAGSGRLDRRQRAELARRSAGASWSLGRLAVTRHPLVAVTSLGRALRRDPFIAFRKVRRFIQGGRELSEPGGCAMTSERC